MTMSTAPSSTTNWHPGDRRPYFDSAAALAAACCSRFR